jgi:hypothetical protein
LQLRPSTVKFSQVDLVLALLFNGIQYLTSDKSVGRSVKTFTYESLNNIARFINGISALLLTLLPGKGNNLEGISGWELKPALRGPHLPRWMERYFHFSKLCWEVMGCRI